MFSHGLMGSWGLGAPRDPKNSGESNGRWNMVLCRVCNENRRVFQG